MPELPEVDVMARYLANSGIVGRTINCHMAEHKAFAKFYEDAKVHRIVGTQILGVWRKAKYLLFQLDNGFLVGHNKFTGFWSYEGEPWTFDYLEFNRTVTTKDIRWRMELIRPGRDPQWLNYHDGRCLGSLKFEETRDPSTIPYLAHMGPDILITSKTHPAFRTEWTSDILKSSMRKTGQSIKAALLDQKRQAGIGNIYACEALWLAGINPFSRAKDLSDAQLEALWSAVNKVVTDALMYKVKYDKYIKVFRQEVCPRCQSPVSREVQQNRGTYMCKECQS